MSGSSTLVPLAAIFNHASVCICGDKKIQAEPRAPYATKGHVLSWMYALTGTICIRAKQHYVLSFIDICSQGADFQHIWLYCCVAYTVIVIHQFQLAWPLLWIKKWARDMGMHVSSLVDYALASLGSIIICTTAMGGDDNMMWIDVANDGDKVMKPGAM